METITKPASFLQKTNETLESDSSLYVTTLNCIDFKFLLDYQIVGKIFVAGATYIHMVLSAISTQTRNKTVCVDEMRIEKTLVLKENDQKLIYIKLMDDGRCEIFSRNENLESIIHASFKIPPVIDEFWPDMSLFTTKAKQLDDNHFYESLSQLDIKYGASFRRLRNIQLSHHLSEAKIANLASNEENCVIHPTTIYSGFQLLTLTLAHLSQIHGVVLLPVGIRHIKAKSVSVDTIRSARFTQVQVKYEDNLPVSADVCWFDVNKECLLIVKDFKIAAHKLKDLQAAMHNYIEKNTLMKKPDSTISTIQNVMMEMLTLRSHVDDTDLSQFVALCWIVIVWATRIIDLFE